jgi:hypothetical protein
MTIKGAISSAVRELPKAEMVLPQTWPVFKSSPDVFVAETLVVLNQSNIYYGRPALLGTTSEQKQDASHRAFSITGQWTRDNGKRPLPANEAWIVCASAPIRPGEAASQTSVITVNLVKGKLTPELAEQLALLRAHLEPWFDN